MSFPELDPVIEVLPGTDVQAVWDRFEVFEALHHSMAICNPMTSAELDEAIEALAVQPGSHILDVASGYGELLFRTTDAAREITGTGIDLSPWMVAGALARSRDRSPDAAIHWVLGEASDYVPSSDVDIAVCSGAEWIWHGVNGTVRALSRRVPRGGRVMIGVPRLHLDADPDNVAAQWGKVETIDDITAMFATHGLAPLHRVDPDDGGWDAYLERTAKAAKQWAQQHPGERADRWLEEQTDWAQARERDRYLIGWSVWIAEKRDSPRNRE